MPTEPGAVGSTAGLGVALIQAERVRQMEEEGWTREHDDTHTNGELAAAGGCYALAMWSRTDCERLWPWAADWKPSDDRMRNLVRAGALIAAEIDRLDRERRKTPNDKAQR